MRMQPLPGSVPTGRSDDSLHKLLTKKQTAEVAPTGRGSAAPGARIRPDFQRELEARLEGWLGQPGSERFENLKPLVSSYLKPEPTSAKGSRVDLDKLPEKTKADLEKLEHAAEGMEAIFVKKLLSQMRSISFDKKGKSPMGDFAKDMMDQKVAEQAAKGQSSIGIARMVFLDTAQTMVRSAIAKPPQKD